MQMMINIFINLFGSFKITNKERAHLLISDLYFNTGEYTKSARKYLNFLKKYPGSEYVPEVLFSLSQIFYNTESYELAKVYLEKLLDVARYHSV